MRSKRDSWAAELSERIREVRTASFGARGRARFARALGVSPSTYNYYERGRIPPIPILLTMSEVGGVDLRWLLTGRSALGQPSDALSPTHARLLTRLSALLPQRAEAAAALNAVLDLLETQPKPIPQPATQRARRPAAGRMPQTPARIPVLGRTAAGVPHFWTRPQKSIDVLHSAIAREPGIGGTRDVTLTGPEEAAPLGSDTGAHLVQLAKPVHVGELYIAEFLDCPKVGDRWPNAFALRIDGDSMHPSLSHGDLLILSPRELARPGRPAVVQLRDQIGVTCKLFYKDKTDVHLIPINEQFQPTKHPLEDLVWALAVLYRVRLSGYSPSERNAGEGET